MKLEKLAAALGIVREFHKSFLKILMELIVPGMKNKVDPWAYSMAMGQVMASADPEQVPVMRQWSTRQWKKAVDTYIEERKEELAEQPELTPGPVTYELETPKPALPAPTETLSVPAETSGKLPIPSPPPWMSVGEREAWIQARTRAGELVRGLGDYVERKTTTLVFEIWDGEEIKTEANREARLRTREQIREKTAEAIEHGWGSKKLARELENLTKDYARKWDRIARTELRGAYNEGAAIMSHRLYGDEAQVARVPNGGACQTCRRLFLSGGVPIVFKVSDLIDNGTNAGRKEKDFLPTLWPAHPNCRCDTQIVPPGYRFDKHWSLVRKRR